MANNIERFKKYVPLLDELYRIGSLTSILDAAPGLVRETANASEVLIPKRELSGLADFDRNTGYVNGNVSMSYQTKAYNYSRGRRLGVDVMDNEETLGVAFGDLAGQFMKQMVIPEVDAVRFAAYASAAGIGKKAEALTTGDKAIAALRLAMTDMDEAEVPEEDRILFINSTLHGIVQDLDTTKSREVLSNFSSIVKVPQTRFYTKVALVPGEDGGYNKPVDAKDINFMVVHKESPIQVVKHAFTKIFKPEENQINDDYAFFFRIYGMHEIFDNKVKGIYANHKA